MDLRKVHNFFKKLTYLRKVPEFENITRTWKKYMNFGRHGQKQGGTALIPVKTMNKDESYPVSAVKGASCPVLEFRD